MTDRVPAQPPVPATPDPPAIAALIERDPRNPDHVRAALLIIAQKAQNRITHATRAVMNRLKTSNPIPDVVVSDVPQADEKLVCRHFLLEFGLVSPDNIIGLCDHCHGPIQFRPSVLAVQQKLCLFCAVDIVLHEQIDDQSPSSGGTG